MEEEDIPQFAKRIKEKFPDYADLDDYELTERIVRKHPVYASKVALPKEFKLLTTSSGYPQLDELYEQAGREHNVDPNLLLEQGRKETRFKPDVIYGRTNSPAGAQGAGQFMPGTAPIYDVRDRTDPIQSVHGQAKYMRKLLDDFDNDEALALAGYNAGEYRKSLRQGKIPNIAETQDYVKEITAALEKARQVSGKSLRDFIPQTATPTVPVPTPNLPSLQKPVPEAPATLEQQTISALDANSPRAGVLLTSPSQIKLLDPAMIKPFKRVKVKEGILLVNPSKAKGITDYQASLAAIIGKAADVKDTSQGPAVLTTAPNGTELTASATPTPEIAQQQIAMDQRAHPGSVSQVVDAQDVVAQRPIVQAAQQAQNWLATGQMPVPQEAVQQEPDEDQKRLQQEYETWRTANNLEDSQASVDEFNKMLKSRTETAAGVKELGRISESAKAGKLSPDADYRRFIAEKGLPHSQESIDIFNEDVRKRNAEAEAQARSTAAKQTVAAKATTSKPRYTEADFKAWAKYSKVPMNATTRKAFEGELAESNKAQFGKGTEISYKPSDFQVGETPVTSSEFDQVGSTKFQRDIGTATDDFHREIGTSTVDPKLKPEEKVRIALNAQLSRYGVTPQEVDAYIKTNPNALKIDPASSQVAASFANLAEIKGDDYAREQMRHEQAQGRTDSNVGIDLDAGPREAYELLGYVDSKTAAKYLKENLGEKPAAAIGGWLGEGASAWRTLAGGARLIEGDDGSVYKWMQETAEPSEALEAKTKRPGFDLFNLAGHAPGFISRMYLMTRIPGTLGTVAAFAAEAGLESRGRGEDWATAGKAAGKSGAIALLLAGAPLIGRIASKSPAVKSALGKAVLDKSAQVATGAVGTMAIEKFSGSSDEQAIQSGIMTGLFQLYNIGAQIKGRTARGRDSKGNEVNVAVDKDGGVRLLKGNVEKPDIEFFFNEKTKQWEAQNGPGKTVPTEAPKEVNVTPDGEGGYARETKGLLGDDTPQRIEVANPEAVQKASIDTRVGKVVDALKTQTDFVDTDTLAKATRMNKTNLEDAIMTLYGARLVEILPGNRVRLIGEPQKTDLFEKAKTYGQTPETSVSQPSAPVAPNSAVSVGGRSTPSAPVTGKSPESAISGITEPAPTAEPNAAAPEYKGKTVTHPQTREQITFTGQVSENGSLVGTNAQGRERRMGTALADKLISEQENVPTPVVSNEVEKSAEPESEQRIARNFRAGTNDATLVFDSPIQRDLYDYYANEKKAMQGGGQRANQTRAKDLSGLKADLAKRLGVPESEIFGLAKDVSEDVKAQMKGVKHLEERTVADNVTKRQAASEPQAQPAPVEQTQPRPFKDPATTRRGGGKFRDLTQFVRSAGGIRPDATALREGRKRQGELDRLNPKETGTTGLINKNSRYSAEQMAQAAWESGYLRDVFETASDVNPEIFLEHLENDFRGVKKNYSSEHDEDRFNATYQQQEDEYYAAKENDPEAREEYHRRQDELLSRQIAFLNDADAKKLLAKVSEEVQYDEQGNVRLPAELKREFDDKLDQFGLEPFIHDTAVIDAYREALTERESPTTVDLNEGEPQRDNARRAESAKPIDSDVVAQQVDAHADSFFEDTEPAQVRDIEKPRKATTAKPAQNKPDIAASKVADKSRPTLHGVAPQEITPIMQARVLYAREQGTTPADIAERFNLTPEQVESVGELPKVGSGGQMSYKLIRAMVPSKAATTAERAEKIAIVNDLAAELKLPEARLDRDTDPADVKNASDLIRLAIAKEMGRGRASEMSQTEWMKWIDSHGDRLSYDTIAAMVDAFDHAIDHARNKVDPFVSDQGLRNIVAEIDQKFGLDNLAGYRSLPSEIRVKIEKLGYQYGLKRTAIQQAFSRSFLDFAQEESAGARNTSASGTDTPASKTKSSQERPRRPKELDDVQFSAENPQSGRDILKKIRRVRGLPNLDKAAKFQLNDDGVLVYLNPAAGAVIQDIMAESGHSKASGVTGFYGHTNYPEKFVEAAERLYGKEFAKQFADAVDANYGDLTVIPGFGKRGTVQEELAHRIINRSGVKAAFTEDLAENPSVARSLDNLDDAYADQSLTYKLDEVFAKSFRDDAEIALHVSGEDIDANQESFYDALLAADVDLESVAHEIENVSQRGKEFSEYVRSRTDGPPRDGKTDAGRETESDIPSTSAQAVRESGIDRRARTRTDERDDRFAKLRQTEDASANRTGSESLISPAERRYIEKHTKGNTDLQKAVEAEVQLSNQSRRSKKDLILSALQSGKRLATDLLNAPRAIKASSDLSAAGRQGLILIPNNPIIAARAFAKQLQMVLPKYGADAYEKFKRDLDLHPYIELAEESKLYLSSLGNGKLEQREEAFMSQILGDDSYFKNRIAEGIRTGLTFPVRASERAYVTMLDKLRIDVFAKGAGEIHQFNLRKGLEDDPKQYEGLARFINYATGRGDLGRLNDLAPILNTTFFSPRYWASRLQVMNPAFYAKLPPGARKLALQNLLAFVGTAAALMVMLKAAGFEVEMGDEDNPDLLKLKLGNYSYEFTAGLVSHIRYAARMIMAGVETKDGKAAASKMKYLTGRYVESKLAPIPSAVYHGAIGETYMHEPTSFKEEGAGLFTPIMADNFRDAFKADGTKGLIQMAPEFFGISTSRHKQPAEIKAQLVQERQALENAKTPAEKKEAARRIKLWQASLERAQKSLAEDRKKENSKN